MKRKLFISLVVAVATGLALVASQATAAGSPSSTRTSLHPLGIPAAAAPTTGTAFATVHEAVAAGKLDAAVARAFAARGKTEAFVSFADVSPQVESALGDAATKRLWTTREARESFVLDFVGTGVDELTEYKTLPLAHVRVESPEALLELVNRPEVVRVSAVGHGTVSLTQSLNVIRQPQVQASGQTGANTFVAVIDTGVDHTRQAFGFCTGINTPSTCKVAASYEFANADNSLDDHGHGTNVAGIVLGVAPGNADHLDGRLQPRLLRRERELHPSLRRERHRPGDRPPAGHEEPGLEHPRGEPQPRCQELVLREPLRGNAPGRARPGALRRDRSRRLGRELRREPERRVPAWHRLPGLCPGRDQRRRDDGRGDGGQHQLQRRLERRIRSRASPRAPRS